MTFLVQVEHCDDRRNIDIAVSVVSLPVIGAHVSATSFNLLKRATIRVLMIVLDRHGRDLIGYVFV